MTNTDYRRALDAACREWETLAANRAALDVRLAELTRTIGTLSRLCGLQSSVPLGLADGCRLVLLRGEALTAREMREALEAIGFDFSEHANPLASIHVTLKRLVQAGQARFIPGGQGRSAAYAAPRTIGAQSRADALRMVPTFFSTSIPAAPKPPRRKK